MFGRNIYDACYVHFTSMDVKSMKAYLEWFWQAMICSAPKKWEDQCSSKIIAKKNVIIALKKIGITLKNVIINSF